MAQGMHADIINIRVSKRLDRSRRDISEKRGKRKSKRFYLPVKSFLLWVQTSTTPFWVFKRPGQKVHHALYGMLQAVLDTAPFFFSFLLFLTSLFSSRICHRGNLESHLHLDTSFRTFLLSFSSSRARRACSASTFRHHVVTPRPTVHERELHRSALPSEREPRFPLPCSKFKVPRSICTMPSTPRALAPFLLLRAWGSDPSLPLNSFLKARMPGRCPLGFPGVLWILTGLDHLFLFHFNKFLYFWGWCARYTYFLNTSGAASALNLDLIVGSFLPIFFWISYAVVVIFSFPVWTSPPLQQSSTGHQQAQALSLTVTPKRKTAVGLDQDVDPRESSSPPWSPSSPSASRKIWRPVPEVVWRNHQPPVGSLPSAFLTTGRSQIWWLPSPLQLLFASGEFSKGRCHRPLEL